MRKSILLIIAMICAITCIAEEHLKFKGIPIEGSMKSFCQKLEAKGFLEVESDANSTLFRGDFAGSNATIGVVSDDEGENVFSVIVMFDGSDEWRVLLNTYNYYKDLYTRKYGKPAQVVENNPAGSDNNTALMAKVDDRTAVWACLWELPAGEIEIGIEKAGFYTGWVIVRYRDFLNEEAKIQKVLEDI